MLYRRCCWYWLLELLIAFSFLRSSFFCLFTLLGFFWIFKPRSFCSAIWSPALCLLVKGNSALSELCWFMVVPGLGRVSWPAGISLLSLNRISWSSHYSFGIWEEIFSFTFTSSVCECLIGRLLRLSFPSATETDNDSVLLWLLSVCSLVLFLAVLPISYFTRLGFRHWLRLLDLSAPLSALEMDAWPLSPLCDCVNERGELYSFSSSILVNLLLLFIYWGFLNIDWALLDASSLPSDYACASWIFFVKF